MPLVPAICIQCGAPIEVDDTQEAGICKHCGTAFITEKVINNYITKNTINVQNASINVDGINIESLLARALEYENDGEYKKAVEYYNKVLDVNANNEIARTGYNRLSTANIGGVVLPRKIGVEIHQLLKTNSDLPAIKLYRETTGFGIEQSKKAIWSYENVELGIKANTTKLNELHPTSNNTSTTSSSNANKGCYIATCIYGSYDCPQVWTLRRFRDYTLDNTWYGRLFIKCYYTISPTLVKSFGNQKWFRTFWKNTLDFMVSTLKQKGLEDTKYNDKY